MTDAITLTEPRSERVTGYAPVGTYGAYEATGSVRGMIAVGQFATLIRAALQSWLDAPGAALWQTLLGGDPSLGHPSALEAAALAATRRFAADVGACETPGREGIEVVETAERIAFVREWLPLNVSQLAAVFGVGRPSVYAWIKGDQTPRAAQMARIRTAYNAARAWNRLSRVPLDRRLIVTPIDSGGSLLDLLSANTPDEARIKSVLETLHAGTAARADDDPGADPARAFEGARARGRARGYEVPDPGAQRARRDAAARRARWDR